eukprot:gene32562-55057_t
MVRPYRIDLGFDLSATTAPAGRGTHKASVPVPAHEAGLAALAEQGLPFIARPYDAWAEHLGWSPATVLETLHRWLEQGTLSRFGMVVRHHEVGYTANAMTVFDVAQGQVDACGQLLAQQPGITLAFQRQRSQHWPYNLYCMVHGQERAEVLALIQQAAQQAGIAHLRRQTLAARAGLPPSRRPPMLRPDQLLLVDYLHGGFPVVDRPFAAVGAALGWSEDH